MLEVYDISFSRYRFLIEAIDPLSAQTYWGNALRGVLIRRWKAQVCQVAPGTIEGNCQGCALASVCAFAQVFEAFSDPVQTGERRYAAPPRPYALMPHTSMGERIEPGALAAFDMVLVGHAQQHIESMCRVFSTGENLGVGTGRYKLVMVNRLGLDDEVGEVVYGLGASGEMAAPPHDWQDVCRWVAGRVASAEQAAVQLITPMCIVQKVRPGATGKERAHPHRFDPFFRAVLRTCNDLAFFACGQERLSAVATRELEDEARAVETDRCRVEEVALQRNSRAGNKGGERMGHRPMGYVGRVEYRGALQPFLPWLALGQYLHIGKLRVEGLGGYRIETKQDAH